MGYNNTATTLSLTAKLTPLGRQRLISTNNALITSFSLGDSDTNYNTTLSLNTGQVPALAGNIGVSSSFNNSTTQRVSMKNFLVVNSSGLLLKSVSSQSVNILTEVVPLGFTTISASSLTQNLINRSDYLTDPLVNLFQSFGLPVSQTNLNTFTGRTFSQGGYSDTSYSAFAANTILVIAISGETYGECVDGKTIKLSLPTTAGTYTIYSTYKGGSSISDVLDASISDPALETTPFGNNVAGLVCDTILTPNGGNPAYSWATGWGTTRPFASNKKLAYNFLTSPNLSITADTLVGLAYLDKGIIVVTDPTIIGNYTSAAASATTVEFDSVSTNVYQSITCIADRGEFGSSTNLSFALGSIPRFTEVGLYDEYQNLIAIAKTDRQVSKNINEFLALGIKISL